MVETVEEVTMHHDEMVLLFNRMCVEAPQGEFIQSIVMAFDAVNYLKATVSGLDPITWGAHPINPTDYMSDEHAGAKRNRSAVAFLHLKKASQAGKGIPVEEEEEEPMDIEEELLVTPPMKMPLWIAHIPTNVTRSILMTQNTTLNSSLPTNRGHSSTHNAIVVYSALIRMIWQPTNHPGTLVTETGSVPSVQ